MSPQERRKWDINEFNRLNVPVVVCTLDSPTVFSNDSHIRVLDMPIRMPDQGWKIPFGLRQFQEVIEAAWASERRFLNPEMAQYCYLTVDQKPVKAGTTQRRPGAHSDAYVEVDCDQVDIVAEHSDAIRKERGPVSHTYICYSALPTEFIVAPFPLRSSECGEVLRSFDEVANETTEPLTYPPYTLLRLDPYVIHRSAVAPQDTRRTFVKISFSDKRYNRLGNTRNYNFDYDWPMQPRVKGRNHPWSDDQAYPPAA